MKKFGSAVVLAGGKSLRMGFDKQLIEVNERKIVENIINILNEEFEEIILVTNKPQHYISENYRIVKDQIVGKGPLSGIHIGLKEASSEYVYFIACDMPNINIDYIKYMKSKITRLEVDACITRFGQWIEPFNSFYSKSLIDSIEENLKMNKRMINILLEDKECCYISEEDARKFSIDWGMFLNLNTKKDLENYTKDNKMNIKCLL
ncbi:MAG: molybdenum cofactor guanylyltransferase [Bacillota bacterium]|nr:molybdenum cofactor guanylyltransferase [Bacillota bacterium]